MHHVSKSMMYIQCYESPEWQSLHLYISLTSATLSSLVLCNFFFHIVFPRFGHCQILLNYFTTRRVTRSSVYTELIAQCNQATAILRRISRHTVDNGCWIRGASQSIDFLL